MSDAPATAPSNPPAPSRTGPFTCGRAPELLGHPSSTASQCSELLPSFWRVVLEGGDLPHGTIFRTVWEGPREVTERGEPALGAYLRRSNLASQPALDRWKLGQLLEALGALPAGFKAEHLDSARDPSTREEGGIALEPLRVTLIAPGYRPPTQPVAPNTAPGEPTGPGGAEPGGPGEPMGGVPTGPGGAEPGGPPGAEPAGPGGPGGGYSPPSLGRAVLAASGDAFTWTVDWRNGPTQPWQRVSESRF
jgi:hypothetical protein